ncbi:MAG: glycosyltransferase family 2 protein [Eubacteriales bacterium]|nr:glycosyltransferase family 2 protein [Eubacteriales bacterium]
MPKISIIMPVYKVEKYLPKAIYSIISQTFESWELFLIDDGSPDNSPKICDEYAKRDERINVIHKNNEGAAIARNVALTKAVGEYICFFDSDDYVEQDMLKNMYEKASDENLDLLICGFYIETFIKKNNSYFTLHYVPEDKIYHNKENFRKEAYKYFDNNMFYSPWNKLFKREYIKNNNIKFKNIYRDDFPFVIDTIKDIEHIGFMHNQYYHFLREREDSETQKYVPTLFEKREEEHNMVCTLYKYWNLYNDKNSLDMISRRYIDRIIECFVNFLNPKSNLSKKNIYEKISNIISSKEYDEALNNSYRKKIYLKIMYLPLKLKNVFLIYLEAKFIYYMKNKNIKIFNALKKNRK